MTDTSQPPAKSCPLSICSFSFCTVAKILVGIPALSLAAIAAASFFASPFLKFIAMVTTVYALVFLAIKIDRMPLFSKMIIKKNCSK